MRTDLFRRAAPPGVEVQTIVVPVGGRLPDGVQAAPHSTITAGVDRAAATALLSDPVWRDRLARAGALPPRTASPALADAVVSAVELARPVALHVMRSYLAPLGAAVAERLGVERATLDLDEDEGPSADRLLGVFGPLYGGRSAASAAEAAAIAERHGFEVAHLPNAVDVGPLRPRTPCPEPTVVLVGNLTYPPNVEAATTLVFEVLPRLPGVRAVLAGPHDGGLAELAGPGVEVTGFVADLSGVYAAADIAVVPLRAGAGTRIKLLEAFAEGVPVVASSVAAAGLDLRDGVHLLLADGAAETAAAVERLLADPAFARHLAEAAHALVRARYSTTAVLPLVRDFLSPS
jgi:glycosyltransferase involved in cell wall biosynthesis